MKLTQEFCLVALNGEETDRMTTGKRIALRCAAAGVVLELLLDQKLENQGGSIQLQASLLEDPEVDMYQESVIKALLKRKTQVEGSLKWWIEQVSRISGRNLKRFERLLVDSVKGMNLLGEKPNLLGCDLMYTMAKIDMMAYCADAETYTRLVEGFRAGLLEDIPLSKENLILYWLYRESGQMLELFSKDEIQLIDQKLGELYLCDSEVKQLVSLQLKHGITGIMRSLVKKRNSIFKSQFATGISFVYPVLNREQNVFIETEEYLAGASARITEITKKIAAHGHSIDVLRAGAVPLIRVDNLLYEMVPTQVRCGNVPIFGVQLRRYRL